MSSKWRYGKRPAPSLVTGKIDTCAMSKIRPVNKSLCLEQLCDSNYRKLLRLIPGLLQIQQDAVAYAASKPELHLQIIDKAPYTITVELSHRFNRRLSDFLEPAVKLRIYLDARLVEVLSDHARVNVHRAIDNPGRLIEVMDYKWTLNYFLDKWLDHCLKANYEFSSEQQLVAELTSA